MTAPQPTADIAWQCTEYLLELIGSDPALADVRIDPGWPGDEQAPQAIWVSDIDANDLEHPIMTGARIPANENFEVHLQVGVFDQPTTADTQARLAEILGAIDSTLREAPNLGAAVEGVKSALVTSKRRTVAVTPEGPHGYAEVVVRFETRIT